MNLYRGTKDNTSSALRKFRAHKLQQKRENKKTDFQAYRLTTTHLYSIVYAHIK
jgi:hypothetical protein